MRSVRKRWIGLAVVLMLAWVGASAQNLILQPKTNAPYSRFGLGDPVDPFYAAAAGMGGVGASFFDPSHVNVVNPASLGWLQVTAFEVGMSARYSGLRGGDDKSGIWSGNMNYLTLAFPLKNPINQVLERSKNKFGWGTVLALQPHTNVGYNVEARDEVPGIGQTTTFLKGTGGTTKLLIGNGLRFGNLSIGLEAGYIFGKIINNRRITLDSVNLAYTTELQDDISIKAWQWKGGLQYTLELDKKEKVRPNEVGKTTLTAGAYLINGADFETNSSSKYQRDNYVLSSEVDTIIYRSDILGKGRLPVQMGFGLTFEKRDQLKISAEYNMGKWSQYENEAKPETLKDNWQFLFGGELIPDITSYNNYFQRMRYRAGFFYGTDPRSVNGSQLLEYGVTVGLGFPIILPRQTTSFVNLAFEVGHFGLKDAVRENYAQMVLGFTLNDNSWFFKRKFN